MALRLSRVLFLIGGLIVAALVVWFIGWPASLLNSVIPRGTFSVEANLSYGDHPRQTLDIYWPSRKPYQSAVVVFIYGGSWESGRKDQYLFVGEAFARLGYVTVIPDYRLWPEAEFPDFVDDIASAIARLPGLMSLECPQGLNVILVGHSAGGHTAAMLATDPRYLARNGGMGVRVRALVGLAAPYDLPLDHERVVDKFTRVENDRQANPIRLATVGAPPSLLLHGAADTTAYPYHTERFEQRLSELGVPVSAHLYPQIEHVSLLASLGGPLRFLNSAYEDIGTFLSRQGLDHNCQPPSGLD